MAAAGTSPSRGRRATCLGRGQPVSRGVEFRVYQQYKLTHSTRVNVTEHSLWSSSLLFASGHAARAASEHQRKSRRSASRQAKRATEPTSHGATVQRLAGGQRWKRAVEETIRRSSRTPRPQWLPAGSKCRAERCGRAAGESEHVNSSRSCSTTRHPRSREAIEESMTRTPRVIDCSWN